jgi:uncharacterized membrane protein YphA (DoxX/SURF4 family)
MSWVLLMIQLSLGVTFILAATGKSLRTDEFKTLLRFSGLSERAVAPVAVLVPALELGVAAALLLQGSRSLVAAFGVAAGLFAIFTAWMVWVRARGLHLRCGCFGTGGSEIGPRSIQRNLVLLGLAVAGLAIASRTPSPLPGPSIWLVITLTASGLCAALIVALRAARPNLVLSFDLARGESDFGREG